VSKFRIRATFVEAMIGAPVACENLLFCLFSSTQNPQLGNKLAAFAGGGVLGVVFSATVVN